jgi:MscS family membrane protein
MKNKNRIKITGIFILVFCVFLSTTTVALSQSVHTPIIIGEDDTYTKEIELGAAGGFYWTVFKNSSGYYAVSVHLDGLNDLSTTINPSDFVLSDSSSYETVTLTVSVPKFPRKEQHTASVIFTYRQLNSTQKYDLVKQVNVSIIGVPYSEQENTIIGEFANPLPPPLDNPYGAFLLNILIWLLIAFLIYIFINKIVHVLVRKTKTELDDAIVEILRTPVLVIAILYGVLTSFIRLGIQLGIRELLFQIFSFVVLGIVIYIIYKIYNEILEEITIRKGGHSSSFGVVLHPIFKIIGLVVIVISGLIYFLSILGVNITALLAGAGVFGLVIAFAAQDTLSNFFSGIHLLLDRPFQLGDIIQLESGEYCRIENVGMRSTKLYSIFDQMLIILPNNIVAGQKIINVVKPDTKIRQRIQVGVAYGSDVEKVKEILYTSAINHADVLKEGEYEPFVRFMEFGDSSLNFTVFFTVDDVMKQWKARSDIVTEIDRRFRNEGITIPFPQRTVWLHEMENKIQTEKKTKDE